MAQLKISECDVVGGRKASQKNGTAADQIEAGNAVVSVNGKIVLASAADGAVSGIARHRARNGQPIAYQDDGPLCLGPVLEPGEIYILGDTPGSIVPSGDKKPGWKVTVVGVATSKTTLALSMLNTGATVQAPAPA